MSCVTRPHTGQGPSAWTVHVKKTETNPEMVPKWLMQHSWEQSDHNKSKSKYTLRNDTPTK